MVAGGTLIAPSVDATTLPPGATGPAPVPKTQATSGVNSVGTPGQFVTDPTSGIEHFQASQQPASEPTTLSSDKTSTITDNTNRLTTLQNTGLTLGPEGLARYSDGSFATAPSDATPTDKGTWQSGGVEYAIGPATTVDPELKGFYDQINQMKATFDATSKANLDLIHQQFDQLRQQQQDINTRQQASVGQSLLLGGTARYAPENAAAITATQASYGLRQIADLNTKEQQAIVQAQQAQESGDMQLMDKSLTIAEDARKEKQTAAQKLSDTLTQQAKDLKDKQAQSAQDQAIAQSMSNGNTDVASILKDINSQTNPITGQKYSLSAKDVQTTIDNLSPDAKNVADVMKTASTNGAPKDVLQAIGQSKTYEEAILAAKDWLGGSKYKTETIGGDLYQYQTDAQGKIIGTPRLIQKGKGTTQERTDAAVSAYGQAFTPGKAMADGTPVLDQNGFITPDAWKAAIADAPKEGISRADFIKNFGYLLFSPKGQVDKKYGLTQAEQKLITGSVTTTQPSQ